MDRPTQSDEFYRKAEARRKVLAAQRQADPRPLQTEQLMARREPPPRMPARLGTPRAALVTLLGVVALVACVVSATAVVLGGTWLQQTLNSPTSTVQAFYGAVQHSDYAGAYHYFSTNAQAHVSEPAFADQFGGYDAIEGTVAHVSIGAARYSANGTSAQVTVQVTRTESEGRLQVDHLMLVKGPGSWKISSISLQFGVGATPTARP